MAKEEVSVALSHFIMFSVKSPLGSPRECGKFEADVAGMRGSGQHRLDLNTMLVADAYFSILLPGRGSREGQRLDSHTVY